MAGWTIEVIIMLSQLLDVVRVEAEAELGNMVFLFDSTKSEYLILVFLSKENKFNLLTEVFV